MDLRKGIFIVQRLLVKNKYVVGYLFDEDLEHVLLIRKKRPDWQAGKLNGVGGRIEHGEMEYEAMAREFEEEAGMRLFGWSEFCVLRFPLAKVYFYARKGDIHQARQCTDEELVIKDVDSLFHIDINQIVSNVIYTVPLGIEYLMTLDEILTRR